MQQRVDARRNRDALLAAAEQVFAEQGVSAPLELVHARAGLGRATLYRNFPDRQSLLLALVDRSMARIEQEAGDFWSFLTTASAFVAESEVIQAIWDQAEKDSEARDVRRHRLAKIAGVHLQNAKDAGTIREDIEVADILLILRMIGGAARTLQPALRKATAERALELLSLGNQM